MVQFTIKEMLESGVHYGHSTRRWNPKMSKFIYGTYNGVHILNLQKTAPLLANALDVISKVVSTGGRVLFVGTKKQTSPIVKEYAEKCGQYFINHRWLGGMLTNHKTISQSIHKLEKLDKQIAEDASGLTKKEKLNLHKDREKLNSVLGGIRKMGGLPDLIVVLDSIKEAIAIEEANKLGIPVVAIVDSNANPDHITYPIPGNDDAIKAITFFCHVMSCAVLEGLKEEAKAGKDFGENPDLDVAKEPANENSEELIVKAE